MSGGNQSCGSSKEDLQRYQHHVYAVVYVLIFGSGLLGNLLALWVFWRYVKETKKAVVFMMNLAVADLMQVIDQLLSGRSLPWDLAFRRSPDLKETYYTTRCEHD